MDPSTLRTRANVDPDLRYPRIGQLLPVFDTRDHEDAVDLSPKFLELMEHAPDRAMFLGDLRSRIFPSSWSGSLADILERRRTMLEPLASYWALGWGARRLADRAHRGGTAARRQARGEL